MKNKLSDLRNHLFETIERLKDKEDPMEVERAKAVSQVAQTIIESAKVELKAAELIGAEVTSEFLQLNQGDRKPLIAKVAQPRKGLSTGKDLGVGTANAPEPAK